MIKGAKGGHKSKFARGLLAQPLVTRYFHYNSLNVDVVGR